MENTITVSKLTAGTAFSGNLMVRQVERRTGKTGRDYLDLILGDRTGDINAKLWDLNALPHDGSGEPHIPVASGVVWIDGAAELFNGRIQFRINKIDLARSPDLRQLIPSAPETAETYMAQIEAVIESFAHPELKALVREMLAMAGPALSYYPAAQRMHHAERTGLLHHTASMLNTAEHICAAYPFLNRELLLAAVIIHDLAKIKEMVSDKLGNVADYSRDGLLVGHLVRGVSDLDQAARNIGMAPDDEVLALLEHMVISHHGIPEYGSPRFPMFPEAEALHWIDTLDARMNEMQGIQERTPAGAFSEPIKGLDNRRLYHPYFTAAPEQAAATPEA